MAEAEVVEWVCPGCSAHEVVPKKGHHICTNCNIYGFNFDMAPYPPVPVEEGVVYEPDPEPPLPKPCDDCSDAEWNEFLRRFPLLALEDANRNQIE